MPCSDGLQSKLGWTRQSQGQGVGLQTLLNWLQLPSGPFEMDMTVFTSRNFARPPSGKASLLIPAPHGSLGSRLPHRKAGGHDRSIKETAQLLICPPPFPGKVHASPCASGPTPVLTSLWGRGDLERRMQRRTHLHFTNRERFLL